MSDPGLLVLETANDPFLVQVEHDFVFVEQDGPRDRPATSDAQIVAHDQIEFVMLDAPQSQVLVIDQERVEVIAAGAQGPAGKDASSIQTETAAMVINGHRAVSLDANGLVVLTDPSNRNLARNVAGISLNAANAGEPVDIQCTGQITFSGWSWTPGLSVFVAPNGALTQTRPMSGARIRIGAATSAIEIVLNVQEPIFLT